MIFRKMDIYNSRGIDSPRTGSKAPKRKLNTIASNPRREILRRPPRRNSCPEGSERRFFEGDVFVRMKSLNAIAA
jgi:hypothetical protein